MSHTSISAYLSIMAFTRCGRDYCDAKMVMSAADAMATNGMKELGYEYVIISGENKLYV